MRQIANRMIQIESIATAMPAWKPRNLEPCDSTSVTNTALLMGR